MVGIKNEQQTSHTPKLVIIDTDPGIDDFMALALAFSQHPHNIHILGLTIVFGNNDNMPLLSRNAHFTREICQRNHFHNNNNNNNNNNIENKNSIPIITGASQPLNRKYHGGSAISIHGENGLGNHSQVESFMENQSLEHFHSQNMDSYNQNYGSEGAAKFMVDMCQKYPGDVHLITLGPLTNIADAVKMNPSIVTQMASITIMGGSIHAGGNITPSSEANIYNDPESAHHVFHAGFRNMTLVPIDVTSKVHLHSQHREQLKERAGDVGSFIYDITEHYISAVVDLGLKDREQMPTHDPTAVICFLRPDLFTRVSCYVDIELEGKLTLGATVADWRGKWHQPANMDIALNTAVDPQKLSLFYEKQLIEAYGF